MARLTANYRTIALTACFALAARAFPQQADTITRQQTLRDVNVRGYQMRSGLNGSVVGTSVVDLALLDELPRILGNADPMHYAQMLPGVQSNAEFNSGLHILGSDNQHNLISIDGVPVYNVSHLLGFFSVFNATHFQRMQVVKSPTAPSAPNRLGGTVDMLTDTARIGQTSGTVSVGPMSSQGTIRLPLGRSQLTVSARAAYLNLLYSQWLKFEDEQLNYDFGDYNLTWQYRPDARNTVWLNGYYGYDNVGYDNDRHYYRAKVRWQNAMAALHWLHEAPGATVRQSLYYTRYDNRFHLNEDNLHVALPSAVADVGYRLNAAAGRFEAGAEAVAHTFEPQSPDVDWYFGVSHDPQPRERATEASLYGGYAQPLGDSLLLKAALRGTLYRHDHRTFYAADPSVQATLLVREGLLRLSTSLKHQYLFRTGFSDVGLPSEFWTSSNAQYRPQYALGVALGYEQYFARRAWRLEAELYWKRLWHQTEYNGNIYDFLYSEYHLEDYLLKGSGRNYGLSLMLEKRKGRLTGWVAYTLGRARRRFADKQLDGWYPATHERIHELNALATMRLGRRWHVGATYVLASGTPYTTLRKFYVVNNNLLTEYGSYNGSRLRPYMRLDLSASYDLKTQPHRSGLNLSLYNVTLHNNDLFYRLRVYKDKFANRPYRFAMPILPSVNYYYEF